jgi:hypothetical protein
MRSSIEFMQEQIARIREEPVERLLKPGIKSVVIIGVLSLAAHHLSKPSLDRQGLARLSSGAKVVKEPSKTGSIRRQN